MISNSTELIKLSEEIYKKYSWDKHIFPAESSDSPIATTIKQFYGPKELDVKKYLFKEFHRLSKNGLYFLCRNDNKGLLIISNKNNQYRVVNINLSTLILLF